MSKDKGSGYRRDNAIGADRAAVFRAKLKAARAELHKQQRRQRGRRRKQDASNFRPGMIRISPRTADDGDVLVVVVLPRWQVRSVDGRIAGPGDRALLHAGEAQRLAADGIVTILDDVAADTSPQSASIPAAKTVTVTSTQEGRHEPSQQHSDRPADHHQRLDS
jgi:hypothetical protein